MSKRSNSDLHSSKTFGSQVLGCSDSLLLPSEPPDIRNWFSSYVYESPELNTEGFEGFGSSGGSDIHVEESCKEIEENLGENGKIGKGDELGAGEAASVGLVECNNTVIDDKYLCKVSGDSESLSLSSEPPEIKNWFSSYVYESPELDTGDDFRFSDSKESQAYKLERRDAGKSSNRKEEPLRESRNGKGDDLAGQEIASKGSVNFNCFADKDRYDLQDNRKVNQCIDDSKGLPVPCSLPFKGISEQYKEGKKEKNHHSFSTNDIEKSSEGDNDFTMKPVKLPEEANSRPSSYIHKCSTVNSGSSPINLIHRKGLLEEGSEDIAQMVVKITKPQNNLALTLRNGDSVSKSSGANGKENDRNDCSENVFISTRKTGSRRIDGENSLKVSHGVQSECFRNKSVLSGKENATIKRRVLSERTNLEQSDILEITGKWSCPQRSKPNLGPPLKQLRLEQWVRRV